MSLLDRVERVSSASSGASQGVLSGASHGGASHGGAQSAGLEEAAGTLKEALFARLPNESIAAMLDSDPARAAREVESVLKALLKTPRFAGLEEHDKLRLAKGIRDAVVGLGPLQPLMDDPEVTEVMANGPGAIFFERDGVLHPYGAAFSDLGQMRAVIDRILGPVGRRVDERSPMVSARLPGGHRANIVVAPVSMDGADITIRKFRNSMFTLAEMELIGTIDEPMRMFLSWAVRARKNIAVSGGTGSGKTTFLNALSGELPRSERIVTIEDAAELRFDWHPHVVRLEARPANAEGVGQVSIRDLVINALRMRPDRIVVGECRGAEALDMLQAMNTGHDGSLTTLHANSPEEVGQRLATMVRFGSDLPADVVESQIASALDLVVHLARRRDGRRKVESVASCGKSGDGRLRFSRIADWDEDAGRYVWDAPEWVGELERGGIASREEVRRWEYLL